MGKPYISLQEIVSIPHRYLNFYTVIDVAGCGLFQFLIGTLKPAQSGTQSVRRTVSPHRYAKNK